MQPSDEHSIFSRDHTFFGVCEGLGEDFGFNPVYLRMALPLPLYLYPAETRIGYYAAVVVVLAGRRIVCEPRRAAVEAQPEAAEMPAEQDAAPAEVALAA